MGKHAYLIIAHNSWKQLQFLINTLNDSRNDFFLLIDKKSTDFNEASFINGCCNASLTIVEPVSIFWGDYSQIKAELALLEAATHKDHYDYYHLISGVDMPLKSQDEIHDFFDVNQGREFIDFDAHGGAEIAYERMRYYYLLQTHIGRKRHTCLKIFRDTILLFQKILSIDRARDIKQYLEKGSNWFSITDDFARYIVAHSEFIEEYFKMTYCADEVFVQTMLNMSPYKDNWYGFKNKDIQYQNHRYVDWGRGKPYTFSKDEYPTLCKSPYMFARKFSEDIISS
ncbi:beta-1,6-N-acetylglucosaminyltransferase [Pseudobutyrivibrio xylanivorans]|uniref:Peptide O-xylosyltransferase n=1 Tax=Pseudobutyrivibrio xylanivorans TaxID=185007 RepID=A0A5P6VW98_PSEXY|nr:beta-1,6-N-acetylglucosaminyltransferase [Pseudobutyrivibrio xylanivorans]QFJ56321.1 beta-1,6-N-acetylglucosaminyltransferase [Pseudobutyrivibrio xylanivorans]